MLGLRQSSCVYSASGPVVELFQMFLIWRVLMSLGLASIFELLTGSAIVKLFLGVDLH